MKKLILFVFLFSAAIPFNYLHGRELPQIKHEGNINRFLLPGRKIRVYKHIDNVLMFGDFFVKLGYLKK